MPSRDVNAATRLAEAIWSRDKSCNRVSNYIIGGLRAVWDTLPGRLRSYQFPNERRHS